MRRNPKETRSEDHLKILQSFSGKPWLSEKKTKDTMDIINQLKKLKLPILAYNGNYDMTEFHGMRNLLDKNEMVESIIIPNAGGFPLWENPDIVNKKVADWIFSQK
ncbi:MAG: alpha/beta hydrolase [Spirochaetaceae bacterium]